MGKAISAANANRDFSKLLRAVSGVTIANPFSSARHPALDALLAQS